jgi:hypothetical protein
MRTKGVHFVLQVAQLGFQNVHSNGAMVAVRDLRRTRILLAEAIDPLATRLHDVGGVITPLLGSRRPGQLLHRLKAALHEPSRFPTKTISRYDGRDDVSGPLTDT